MSCVSQIRYAKMYGERRAMSRENRAAFAFSLTAFSAHDGNERMKNYPMSIKRQLRELAQQAADAEMRQQLNEVAAQVDAWKQGTITGRELRSVLHAYADGASRELIRKYRETPDDQLVAEALANGILKREETPRDALRFLEQDDDAAA